MSPGSPVCAGAAACFPRVSGDEPAMADGVDKTKLFSPRERG